MKSNTNNKQPNQPQDQSKSTCQNHQTPQQCSLSTKSTNPSKTPLQNPEDHQPPTTTSTTENTCTLNTLIQEIDEEERLCEQLSNNKYTQICRYSSGYIYQQVFSCTTCLEQRLNLAIPDTTLRHSTYYTQSPNPDPSSSNSPVYTLNTLKLMEDSSKLGIKPFGFCLGCMLHCHEGHEVHELYHKLDFRCDCGNSRMLQACNLNHDGKEYENDGNRYDATYYDVYCYCRQRHQDGEMDRYMIQCYHCEDWYHNQHLKPIQVQHEEIHDKYMLLCSRCVKQMGMQRKMHLYQEYFHESIQSYFEEQGKSEQSGLGGVAEVVTKRRKIDDSGKEKKIRNCSQLETNEVSDGKKEDLERENYANIDYIIDDSFLEVLCECSNCTKAFSRIKRMVDQIANLNEDEKDLDNNLEGIVNEDKSTTNTNGQVANGGKVSKDQIFSQDHIMHTMQKIMLEKSKSMPHEAQIYIAENMGLFRDKLYTFFKKFENTGAAVRPEDIRQFFQEMDELRRITLAEHLSISRNPK